MACAQDAELPLAHMALHFQTEGWAEEFTNEGELGIRGNCDLYAALPHFGD